MTCFLCPCFQMSWYVPAFSYVVRADNLSRLGAYVIPCAAVSLLVYLARPNVVCSASTFPGSSISSISFIDRWHREEEEEEGDVSRCLCAFHNSSRSPAPPTPDARKDGGATPYYRGDCRNYAEAPEGDGHKGGCPIYIYKGGQFFDRECCPPEVGLSVGK